MDATDKTEPLDRKVANMERREQLREQVSELGLTDQKQRQAVLKILDENPGLVPAEGLALAAARSPDVFNERGDAGFDQRIHGSLRPTPGARPERPKSDHQQRIEYARKLAAAGHRDAAEEVAIDMIGAAAAKVIGWDYKPKPLPQVW